MNEAKRPVELKNAPLKYAPENEQGVVYLFSHLKKKYRLEIEKIRTSFPDCIAYQKTAGKSKRVRIEFEYKSRNFKNQRHSVKGADWIVCWEHNWPAVPNRIKVIELRRLYGLGFSVWICGVGGEFKERISSIISSVSWSVPMSAHKGDLILYYHNSPDCCIKDIFILTDNVKKVKNSGWKNGLDYMSSIQRVAHLDAPVFLEDLKRHKILKTAGFIRGKLRGRMNVFEYWPYIYEMILSRNPSLKNKLQNYSPERLP